MDISSVVQDAKAAKEMAARAKAEMAAAESAAVPRRPRPKPQEEEEEEETRQHRRLREEAPPKRQGSGGDGGIVPWDEGAEARCAVRAGAATTCASCAVPTPRAGRSSPNGSRLWPERVPSTPSLPSTTKNSRNIS